MDTKKTPLELEIERETEHRVAALKRERAAYVGRDDKKDRLKAVDAELSRLDGKTPEKPRESTEQGQVTREEHVQGEAPQPDAAALDEPQTTTTPQADAFGEPEGNPPAEVADETKPAAKKTAARRSTRKA